jgi:hypothetical protein
MQCPSRMTSPLCSLFSVLLVALLVFGLSLLWLELRHRLRPQSPLQIKPNNWSVQQRNGRLLVEGTVAISNSHQRMEVFVPELTVVPTLLGRGDLDDITIQSRITPQHPDEEARSDGYWFAYIVKGHKRTEAQVSFELQGLDLEQRLDTLWVDVHWWNYGPFGRLLRRDGFLVPLRHPERLTANDAAWNDGDGCQVLPVRTHLLGRLDEVESVLRRYSSAVMQRGDILTVAESPLAVMQGRYQHPSQLQVSGLARQLCRVFHPTSSLATACGLQTLIDQVGPARVLVAWLIGTALKLVGSNGWFYRLAGEQARLIDDVTGSTPPYDQTIVLGPERSQELVEQLAAALGHAVAVVDVNDLGRVKVLASSQGCDEALLERALRPNPAGNANQRTPLVVVRPQ